MKRNKAQDYLGRRETSTKMWGEPGGAREGRADNSQGVRWLGESGCTQRRQRDLRVKSQLMD